MSLLKHWRERKKLFGGTQGRPVWWLVMVLLVVLFLIHLLAKFQKVLPK